MCNENINHLLDVDFATTFDELNWITNSSNAIHTTDGRLVLQPESALITYNRGLGQINTENNRLRFKLNLEIFCPSTGGAAVVNYLVQVYNGTNLVGQSTIFIDGIDGGQVVRYSLDRTYEYEELSGNISIRIRATQGWQNEIRLTKLDVWDYFFCEDKVRTYFVFDGLFEAAQTAMSAGIRCNSWKVGNVETLTPAFTAYNNTNVGGNPITGWKFASADIDGRNRIAAATGRNTFNPFADEFGLIFDTVNSFWGGKPIGTNGNQNFGTGIMQLGLDKPVILNGLLESKAGAFFIDIDYSQNLYIEMDVIINNNSSSVFNNPNIFRRYYIEWNIEKCSRSFIYTNQLQTPPTATNQDHNGFLSGITDVTVEDTVLPCGQQLNFNGNQGAYTFTLDLGTGIGMVNVNYNAQNIPDKFDITWNSQFITTNYRGSSTYNQSLLNAGVPASQIQTANPSNGAGVISFFKNLPTPTTATITVTAPLGGTAWTLISACPTPSMQIWLYTAGCGANLNSLSPVVKFMPSENPVGFIPTVGDVIFNEAALTTTYGTNVGTTLRMRIPTGSAGTFEEVPYTIKLNASGQIIEVTPC